MCNNVRKTRSYRMSKGRVIVHFDVNKVVHIKGEWSSHLGFSQAVLPPLDDKLSIIDCHGDGHRWCCSLLGDASWDVGVLTRVERRVWSNLARRLSLCCPLSVLTFIPGPFYNDRIYFFLQSFEFIHLFYRWDTN